ncbi:aminotransferase [candidate division KSB1 bacterium 4484_87]|nr:MAG: aminotransferase [candidate division KSB1 bacterium 4484_87]
MKTYLIPLVPGPTRVPAEVLAAYQTNYGSSDLEPEFYELYQDTQQKFQKIMGTKNTIVMMNGEAMLVLWAALKSALIPGDKVVSIANGVFGHGIADMARSRGCEVDVVAAEYNAAIDLEQVENSIKNFRPKMVTMVHCETPSGIINPVKEVGKLVKKYGVPLFYVDAVSSVGGAEVKVDDWGIDLCLVGSQKCLGAPPELGIVSVSKRSWKIIDFIDYNGYDSLVPWKNGAQNQWFPYTLSWHSIAAVNRACQLILDEGLKNAIERHEKIAKYCRQRITEMGLQVFPEDESICSPTVTAVKVPENLTWNYLNKRLRARGMAVGGSLGKLANRVFRIGHMGCQANMDIVEHGMDILEYIMLSSRV